MKIIATEQLHKLLASGELNLSNGVVYDAIQVDLHNKYFKFLKDKKIILTMKLPGNILMQDSITVEGLCGFVDLTVE